MTMERVIFLICFGVTVEGDIGKHIFFPQWVNFSEAQAYCRQHCTDLSFINSKSDEDKLLKVSRQGGWIGLQRDPDNKSAWKWSGGGHITYKNWAPGEPNNAFGRQNEGYMDGNGLWYDITTGNLLPFYCINVTVVEQRKSWEEALDHCREQESDLASLLSETELLVAQSKIQHLRITERVWIGLRFLADRWLWVNGDPLVYEAWPQSSDQDHQCPIRKRCGALTKETHWENWDCQDKLNFICI